MTARLDNEGKVRRTTPAKSNLPQDCDSNNELGPETGVAALQVPHHNRNGRTDVAAAHSPTTVVRLVSGV